jgi:hypothetical protein
MGIKRFLSLFKGNFPKADELIKTDPIIIRRSGFSQKKTETLLLIAKASLNKIIPEEKEIMYLNDDWNEEWNGATELWDENMDKCVIKSFPKKNTAILFVTTEKSWHGVPERIVCPKNVYRKTIAFYYISDIINKSSTKKLGSNNTGFREKAVFVRRPQEPYDEKMEKLYKIRPYRLITKNDLDEIYPDWTYEK